MGNYLFEPVHDDFRKTVREFIEAEIAPNVDAWEEAEEFPLELYKRMGELGFLGMQYPEEYGGDDDILAEAVLHEELARCGSAGTAAGIGAHIAIAMPQIKYFGTPEQKDKYLLPGIKGECVGALGITEPNTGSDVAGIQTYAVPDGDDWVINGSKTFITNGARADWVVLAVKTDKEKGYAGITQFLVDTNTPGFEVTRRIHKLGWRASDTAELAFTDMRVPAGAVLGTVNQGFFQIMRNFAWERLTMSLGAVSGAQFAFDAALAYAKERVAFGKPIFKFQAIAHMLAEMATEIEAGRNLTYHALQLYKDGGQPFREVAMAKLFSCDMCVRVTDHALQIFGGYGYTEEYPIARALRDARLGPIGGGTSEIMKDIISKTYA